MMHGLGNMSANQLYSCRLRALAETIREVYITDEINAERELFWLDSLCVPTRSSAARHVAVDTMDAVYRSAAVMLVLDSSLMALRKRNQFQAAFNLWISPWSTRLW